MIDDFATDGALAQKIEGFKPREPQRLMANAVALAIKNKQGLVVEAGTGTGKTYAYLAPALRSGKKVIISTGSKALQDQLYSRDLPKVANAKIQRQAGAAERALQLPVPRTPRSTIDGGR